MDYTYEKCLAVLAPRLKPLVDPSHARPVRPRALQEPAVASQHIVHPVLRRLVEFCGVVRPVSPSPRKFVYFKIGTVTG